MLNFSFIFLILITLFVGNAALSVFLGIFFAYYIKISNTFYSRRVGTIPLQIGIVILGATISMPYALNVSSEYLPWISLFVIISFFSGLILGRILGIITLIDGLGAAYGTKLLSELAVDSGSYFLSFGVVSAVTFFAIINVLFIKPLEIKNDKIDSKL